MSLINNRFKCEDVGKSINITNTLKNIIDNGYAEGRTDSWAETYLSPVIGKLWQNSENYIIFIYQNYLLLKVTKSYLQNGVPGYCSLCYQFSLKNPATRLGKMYRRISFIWNLSIVSRDTNYIISYIHRLKLVPVNINAAQNIVYLGRFT